MEEDGSAASADTVIPYPSHSLQPPPHTPIQERGRRMDAAACPYHIPLAVHRRSSLDEGSHRAPLALAPRPAVIPGAGTITAVPCPATAARCFLKPPNEAITSTECPHQPISRQCTSHRVH